MNRNEMSPEDEVRQHYERVGKREPLPAGQSPVKLKLPPKGKAVASAKAAGEDFRARTEQIALRVPVADLEAVKEIASQRGLGYQTLLKSVIHEFVEHQRA